MQRHLFLHFYGISYSRFHQLKEHYELHGIFPRTHRHTNRLPENTLPYSTIEDVQAFLLNYVEENAITLPVYKSAWEASNKQVVSYRKFLQLWEPFCPNVLIAKPMTDLCSTCQQNTTKLQQAANLSETEKIECIKAQQEHLNSAQAERDFYKYACNLSEKTIESLENDNLLDLRSRSACSLTATIHYSFDYAQQVHIPSNPMQPRPIYFKTPRKCEIFGVICEGFPRQVNFLIDEAASTGKGANATISYVHYYFENYGLGETDAHLHAGNWRILLLLNQTITYSFLIAGHMKFGPDRCFGLIKKVFKVTHISSIYEFAQLVDNSSSVGINKAQLVATHNGRVIVPVYDWASFLGGYFKKILNIKSFHHFRFSKEKPRMVYCKEHVSAPEQSFMLLKNAACVPPVSLPQ